jgi:predicted Zn-ribbon and HTH transcriptional regulator
MPRKSGGPGSISRNETVRASIERILREGPTTARDLSQRLGVREADLPDHLTHVEKSLRGRGERLRIESPVCFDCDFDFPRRHRFTRPGRCPECRGRRLSYPEFSIR